MKYTININQKAVQQHRLDLDIVDCAILDHLMSFSLSSKVVKIQFDNESYYWFNHDNISTQLPILGLKKDAVYRRLKSLCEKGFLKQNPNNKQMNLSYYTFTQKSLLLNYEGSDENPKGTDINPNPSDEKPNYNNIINNNNINNNKESKDSLVSESEDLFGNPKQPKKEKEKNSEKKEKAPEFTTFHFRQSLLELGANEQHLDDWLKVRKQKKAVNSKTALNGFIAECTKSGTEIKEAVETCAKNSWSGFKSSWIQSDKKEDNKGESTFIF